MQATDYQKRLAHNVLSLMPARGFRYQKDLVAKLGWTDAGRLSRLLNHAGEAGRKQRWELSDIIEIGVALGLSADPFILLKPLAEVVGAAPNDEATGTDGYPRGVISEGHFGWSPAIISAPFGVSPQVDGHGRRLADIAPVIPIRRQRDKMRDASNDRAVSAMGVKRGYDIWSA